MFLCMVQVKYSDGTIDYILREDIYSDNENLVSSMKDKIKKDNQLTSTTNIVVT